MNATIKPNQQTTFHRDGSVSFWSVYNQQWVRQSSEHISDQDLASMSAEDRQRVIKMAERAAAIAE